MFASYFLKPPYFIFLQLLIYLGIPYNVFLDFCRFWKFGEVSLNVYNAIVEDAETNKTIANMMKSNRDNFNNNSELKIYKNILKQYDYPEYVKHLIKGISGEKDPSKWKWPESLQYFLRNFRLRQFIECSLLAKLTFSEINRYWMLFDSPGILHEYFEPYRDLFWNISSTPTIDQQLFLKRNCTRQFYTKHQKIVGMGREQLLGEFGLQTQADEKKSMKGITLKVTKKILDSPEEPRQDLHSLLALGCTYIARTDIEHQREQADKNLQNPAFSHGCQLSSSALEVRRRNREYRFKQLLSTSVRDEGAYYE